MTQHWRRSADGHIDAGGLDASQPPQGPGTESNRARAARGGFAKATTLPLYRPEDLAPRRHDPVHVLFDDEPRAADNGAWIVFPDGSRERPHPDNLPALREVGVDHASGPDFAGRTRMTVRENADGARRWEVVGPGPGCDQTLRFHWYGEDYVIPVLASDTSAQVAAKIAAATGGKVSGGTVLLPVPPRPSSVAWSGMVPGPVTPLPSTLAEAERLYGKGSPVWEAVHASVLAGGAPSTPAPQPAPAPGQVWMPPPGALPASELASDGTVTIGRVIASCFYLDAPGGSVYGVDATRMDGWTCVGVATPNGRVMVGDGFAARGEDEASVAAIGAGDSALLRARNGWEQWTNASGLTDGGSTLRRTRYAPARAGERYRWRKTGEVSVIEPGQRGPMGRNEDASTFAMGADGSLDPAQWERLDPGQPTAYEHAAAAMHARDLTLSVGADVVAVGAPPPAEALTLQAPARDLRALFDAIGRALESTTPHSATVAGRVYLVKRDEMLFSPEVAPAADVLVITADTKHLHALRRVVADALADPTGRAHAAKWGKCHMVKAQRVGPALATSTVGAEPTRYQPSEGGANGWRWEVGE